MSKPCLICSDVNRLEIERLFLQGVSVREISKRHDTSYSAVSTHCKNHMSRQIVQAYKTKETLHSLNLLTHIDEILSKTKRILSRNYKRGKDVIALKAISEARQTYELLSKIAISLKEIEAQENASNDEDIQAQEAEEFEESLAILTNDELELFQQLIKKIEEQDKSIKIKLPNKEQAPIFNKQTIKSHDGMKRKRKQKPEPDKEKRFKGKPKVAPIQSKKIPGDD